jgi:endogenous inhibitor of DNA gyrase (YacG/DUF329 family)
VTATVCLVCDRPLSVAQRANRAAHCSIRCAMVTRHGRPAPRAVLDCTECHAPLTTKQRAKLQQFCSKVCAKAALYRTRQAAVKAQLDQGRQTQRIAYMSRLRRRLLACPSVEAAARSGFLQGYSVGFQRVKAAGQLRPRRKVNPDREPTIAAIVTRTRSKSEAFRLAYAAGFASAWHYHTGRKDVVA